MIHPHFRYADIIYDACNVTSSNKLQTHQHLALKMILNVDPRFSSAKLHTETNVKGLSAKRMERCCIEAYRALNDMSLNKVNHLFTVSTQNIGLHTGDAVNFKVSPAKTKLDDGNLTNRCEKYRRRLNDSVKNIDKLSTFKSALRRGDYFAPD